MAMIPAKSRIARLGSGTATTLLTAVMGRDRSKVADVSGSVAPTAIAAAMLQTIQYMKERNDMNLSKYLSVPPRVEQGFFCFKIDPEISFSVFYSVLIKFFAGFLNPRLLACAFAASPP
jgi:hypothetical protein